VNWICSHCDRRIGMQKGCDS